MSIVSSLFLFLFGLGVLGALSLKLEFVLLNSTLLFVLFNCGVFGCWFDFVGVFVDFGWSSSFVATRLSTKKIFIKCFYLLSIFTSYIDCLTSSSISASSSCRLWKLLITGQSKVVWMLFETD
jgi:hypothetical protein